MMKKSVSTFRKRPGGLGGGLNAKQYSEGTISAGLPQNQQEKILRLVQRLLSLGEAHDSTLASLAEERLLRAELESRVHRIPAVDEITQLEANIREKQYEIDDLNANQKVSDGLLALYQGKLKNVSEMFQILQLKTEESQIMITQLQSDLTSMEGLVADQKITIESIERSNSRLNQSLFEAEKSKQDLMGKVELLQDQIRDHQHMLVTMEAAAQHQDELMVTKNQAYARLEERFIQMQADLLSVRNTLPRPPVPSITSSASLPRAATSTIPNRLNGSSSTRENQSITSASTLHKGSSTNVSESRDIIQEAHHNIDCNIHEDSVQYKQDQSFGALYASTDTSANGLNVSFGSSIMTGHTNATNEAENGILRNWLGSADIGMDKNVDKDMGKDTEIREIREIRKIPQIQQGHDPQQEHVSFDTSLTQISNSEPITVRTSIEELRNRDRAAYRDVDSNDQNNMRSILDPTPMKRKTSREPLQRTTNTSTNIALRKPSNMELSDDSGITRPAQTSQISAPFESAVLTTTGRREKPKVSLVEPVPITAPTTIATAAVSARKSNNKSLICEPELSTSASVRSPEGKHVVSNRTNLTTLTPGAGAGAAIISSREKKKVKRVVPKTKDNTPVHGSVHNGVKKKLKQTTTNSTSVSMEIESRRHRTFDAANETNDPIKTRSGSQSEPTKKVNHPEASISRNNRVQPAAQSQIVHSRAHQSSEVPSTRSKPYPKQSGQPQIVYDDSLFGLIDAIEFD